jgi:hypothetical protein
VFRELKIKNSKLKIAIRAGEYGNDGGWKNYDGESHGNVVWQSA